MKGQIKYERQLQNTYMTVDTVDKAIVESYGGQVVLRNNFQGFAASKVIKIDGMELLQYDISNCQDITTVYSVKKLNYKDIITIIVSLNQIIQEMEGYLMDGLQLVLCPEYIYMDMETKKPKFLFDYSEVRRHSDIVKLGEFFIERVDHVDEAATKLAYYFFEASQNGNYNVERMEAYLEENKQKDKEEKEEKTDNNHSLSDSRKTDYLNYENQDDLDEPVSRDDALDFLYGNEDNLEYIVKEKESVFRRIRNFFVDKKSRDKKATNKQATNKQIKETNKNKDREKNSKRNKNTPQYEYYNEEVIIQKEERKKEDLGHTVYIGKSARDRDYVLIEMRRNKEISHSIDTYPFTIGSQKDSVNLYIKDSSVSRIHAKITKNDDAIYIEDIHSTNGTMINDLPLLPHEKNRIKRGDIITLGKTEFEFR